LLVLAAENFGVAVSSPWRAQISSLGFVLALGLTAAACSVRSKRALNWVMLAVLVVAIALTSTEAMAILLGRHGFGEDDGACVQYGTRLLLRGVNPFTHSMAPAFQLYGTPPVPTALTNGSISTAYDYPSLPLLLTVPFYWLTNGVQSVSVAAVFFQCAAAVVLYVMLPRGLRPLAVITIFEIPLLFTFEVSGSFYPMLLPFALVAIWKWTEIGRTGHCPEEMWRVPSASASPARLSRSFGSSRCFSSSGSGELDLADSEISARRESRRDSPC